MSKDRIGKWNRISILHWYYTYQFEEEKKQDVRFFAICFKIQDSFHQRLHISDWQL